MLAEAATTATFVDGTVGALGDYGVWTLDGASYAINRRYETIVDDDEPSLLLVVRARR